MIRLVQRTLIIPRGDTGFFSIPQMAAADPNNAAVFTIFDPKTHTKIFDKQVSTNEDMLTIAFSHFDTVNLPVGKYKWDIKFYQNPVFVNEKLVDGEEVNSYYSAFSLPDCEIRQTGDNLLTADEAPITTLTPSQLNIINNLLIELRAAIQQSNENVTHYPIIQNLTWHVWDATQQGYVDTGVIAEVDPSEYVRIADLQALSDEEILTVIRGDTNA